MNDNDKLDTTSDALEESANTNDVAPEIVTAIPNDKSSNPKVTNQLRNSSSEPSSLSSSIDGDNKLSQNVKSDKSEISSMGDFRVRVRSEGEDDSEQFKDRTDWPSHNDRFIGSESKSLLSEFDEYVAAERNGGGVRSGVSRGPGYGFEVGDMVWGKVKSHPWWPGHIYDELFASPQVRRSKREGHVLVAFFGDSSYGWFEPAELIPFDANFAEKSQQIQSKPFLKAVEEAVDEASRRCGVGLACKCRSSNSFRATNYEGYFAVDVLDYEPGGVYSETQIRMLRNSFKPVETLEFVKQLAFAPLEGDHRSISFIKNRATAFAYRRAVFEQHDETYAQAFGVQSHRSSHSQVNSLRQPPKGICSFRFRCLI